MHRKSFIWIQGHFWWPFQSNKTNLNYHRSNGRSTKWLQSAFPNKDFGFWPKAKSIPIGAVASNYATYNNPIEKEREIKWPERNLAENLPPTFFVEIFLDTKSEWNVILYCLVQLRSWLATKGKFVQVLIVIIRKIQPPRVVLCNLRGLPGLEQ